ncbi:MAG TPA: alpha/beta fold hydrolase, partial [Solirubrobacteraceae bacterium]|nr:alpha/beta fold hydrolase [Solirubrobacteraceae bacterium]
MAVGGGTLEQLAPRYLDELAGRYDAATFEPEGRRARVRLGVERVGEWDVVLEDGRARISPPRGAADALIHAGPATWELIASDPGRGIGEFRAGRLSVRRNMHLGIGFLAATSARTGASRLRFEMVRTRGARISTIQAGSGEPLIAIHGLGGTKGSFLPTVAELGPHYRVIAADLPGFGDSSKPLRG